MKKRIFSVLLALCLMAGILPTAALADSTQTGTVVWFDQTQGASGKTMGYAYSGGNYFAIVPGFSTTILDPVLKVGQTVNYGIVNGIKLSVKEGTLSVTDSDAMSLSISGDAYLNKTLTIDVSNIPSVGSVSVQMYHAVNADEIFNDGNKLGEAVSYTAGTPITHTVTAASIGKFIGAKAVYTVEADGTAYTTTLTAQTARQISVGGSCGENLTWEIADSGENYTLSISGTGAMTDYDYNDNIAPWLSPALKDADGDQFVGKINTLALAEGITHIGSYAFGTDGTGISMQNITFPSTLLSIGVGAFSNCFGEYGLELSMTLPNGLTTLGANAFQSCSGIAEVILPASLTTVGDWAFYRTTQPLAVYSLVGSEEAAPSWAGSWGLTNTGLATIRFLTHHAAVEPTCATAGAEEYYAFEGDGVSDTMAGRYYNAQKTGYSDAPVAIPATGLHTLDETGKCSVCQETFSVDATVKIGDGAAVGYATMTDALKAANAVTGSETVTVTALKSAMDGWLPTVTLTRAAPIVLELGGFTVESDSNVFTISGATVTVKNGTLKGSHNSYIILVNSGTLNLENNVTLKNPYINANALYINGGTVNVNGATIEARNDSCCSVLQLGGTLNVNGGDFKQRLAIYDGNTTLNGGSFAGISVSVTGKTVGDLLGADCGYKTAANAWVSDAESLGGSALGSVTVEKLPVKVTDFTISESSLDSDSGIRPVVTVTTEKTDAEATITYKWEYSSNGTVWIDPSFAVISDNGDSSTCTLPTGLDAGTKKIRCTVSSSSDPTYSYTTEPVSLTINSVEAAMIGSTTYGSFDKAAMLAQNGDTIRLLKDTAFNNGQYWIIDKSLTLDLNGHTLNFGSSQILISNGASLTVKDASDESDGRLTCDCSASFIEAKGSFRLESGSIESLNSTAVLYPSGVTEASSITVTGGSITGKTAMQLNGGPATLTITGGTFTSTAENSNSYVLQTGVTTRLSGGAFTNPSGGNTIAYYGVDLKKISTFLEDGYCYYEGTDTGLNTGVVFDGKTYQTTKKLTIDKAAAASVTVAGEQPQKYGGLGEALAAANGKTAVVTLLRDWAYAAGETQVPALLENSAITLELGGHTATLGGDYGYLKLQHETASLTVQNGVLAGGNGCLILINGGASFALAANATLSAGSGASALSMNNGSAALHGTVTGPDNMFAVVATSQGRVTVDGGSVKSLQVESNQNATLSGGTFGRISCLNVTMYKDMLKSGYAFKGAGEGGTWITAYPASSEESLVNVTVLTAPVLITAQPEDANVSYGSTATLRVSASGVTKYNWIKSGDSPSFYDGNSDGSFAISTTLNVGTYYFQAKCVGEAGWSAYSDFVTVTVTAAELTSVSVAQNGVLVYDGTPLTAAVTAQGASMNSQPVSFTYSDSENGTFTGAVPAFTTVGEHTVYYKASALYHKTTEGSFTVSVVPPIALSAELCGTDITVSLKNNTDTACEYTLYCATYNANDRMLTLDAVAAQETSSGEASVRHFSTAAAYSATHARVFAVKSDSSPLTDAASIDF